jgi:hypothetical protein
MGKLNGSGHDSAEKGEVYVLIGGEWYTYIPNNTAPYGTITKAVQGLTALSNKLTKIQE